MSLSARRVSLCWDEVWRAEKGLKVPSSISMMVSDMVELGERKGSRIVDGVLLPLKKA